MRRTGPLLPERAAGVRGLRAVLPATMLLHASPTRHRDRLLAALETASIAWAHTAISVYSTLSRPLSGAILPSSPGMQTCPVAPSSVFPLQLCLVPPRHSLVRGSPVPRLQIAHEAPLTSSPSLPISSPEGCTRPNGSRILQGTFLRVARAKLRIPSNAPGSDPIL